MPGGHLKTDAIADDLAEIFLGLFVSWQELSTLFSEHSDPSNTYYQIWESIKPTLAPHNQEFAANIELLRKSKEDCQADAKLRKSLHRDDDFFLTAMSLILIWLILNRTRMRTTEVFL